jgi:membrane protein
MTPPLAWQRRSPTTTAFSMAPLLILTISIAGLILGREAAQGKIVEQIGGLVGKQSAAAIQSMIQAANRPSKGIFASVIAIVSLSGCDRCAF